MFTVPDMTPVQDFFTWVYNFIIAIAPEALQGTAEFELFTRLAVIAAIIFFLWLVFKPFKWLFSVIFPKRKGGWMQ